MFAYQKTLYFALETTHHPMLVHLHIWDTALPYGLPSCLFSRGLLYVVIFAYHGYRHTHICCTLLNSMSSESLWFFLWVNRKKENLPKTPFSSVPLFSRAVFFSYTYAMPLWVQEIAPISRFRNVRGIPVFTGSIFGNTDVLWHKIDSYEDIRCSWKTRMPASSFWCWFFFWFWL